MEFPYLICQGIVNKLCLFVILIYYFQVDLQSDLNCDNICSFEIFVLGVKLVALEILRTDFDTIYVNV